MSIYLWINLSLAFKRVIGMFSKITEEMLNFNDGRLAFLGEIFFIGFAVSFLLFLFKVIRKFIY